jgi:tRNA (cmo5U34)-methyltransferase
MLQTGENKRPVHYPRNPDKFEFDMEVAAIFDSMAERSIPGYLVCKELTVAILMQTIDANIQAGRITRILDIGCSTGTLFAMLLSKLYCSYPEAAGHAAQYVELVGMDNSPPMTILAKDKAPEAKIFCLSILDKGTEEVTGGEFDAVVMSYVAQFVPPKDRQALFNKVSHLLIPGGQLILSEKEQLHKMSAELMQEIYIQFRLSNGYSQEEIDAKTRALANAMWPQPEYTTLAQLVAAGFYDRQEIHRWGAFATYLVDKKR